MTNGFEEARQQRNWLERLGEKIPGFSGYIERQERRNSDKLLRDTVSQRVPMILNLRPSGKYLAEDWYYAGGCAATLNVIGEQLHLEAKTVNGQTLGENIKDAEVIDDDVIRPQDNPVYPEGGTVVLYDQAHRAVGRVGRIRGVVELNTFDIGFVIGAAVAARNGSMGERQRGDRGLSLPVIYPQSPPRPTRYPPHHGFAPHDPRSQIRSLSGRLPWLRRSRKHFRANVCDWR